MPSHDMCPVLRVVLDALHLQLNIGDALIEFSRMAAQHFNRLQELNKALEHTAGAKEAIQGFEAEQCIKIMINYEEYTRILHDHPDWEDMAVVFRCVKRISEISRKTFEAGNGLITEFANVITELREVVSRQFAIPPTKNSPSEQGGDQPNISGGPAR